MVEQLPFKEKVPGSIPGGGTKILLDSHPGIEPKRGVESFAFNGTVTLNVSIKTKTVPGTGERTEFYVYNESVNRSSRV